MLNKSFVSVFEVVEVLSFVSFETVCTEETNSSTVKVFVPYWHGDNESVCFTECLALRELIPVYLTESVSPPEVAPVSLKVSISIDAILFFEDVLDALDCREGLFDLFSGVARSIEMILEIPFSSSVTVCPVTCRIREGPYSLDSSLSYLSVLLSDDKVTSRGRSTYTNCPLKILDNN